MSRGILMFGINNSRIDYLKLCYLNALLIKENMGDIPISIVTSQLSLEWDWAKQNIDNIKNIANLIVLENSFNLQTKNTRLYRDTQYYSVTDYFINEQRCDAYHLSPYDETLMIDCDYLILSDSLNSVWGSVEDVLITKDAVHLHHNKFDHTEWRLSPTGQRMFWATIVYFRKSDKAEKLFTLVNHVKQNWKFYGMIYDFPTSVFRNDFAFTIAIHMLSGFQENSDFKPIPDTPILTSLDRDQIKEFVSHDTIILFVKNLDDNWRFSLQKIKNMNVHIMNKLALLNIADDAIESLEQ